MGLVPHCGLGCLVAALVGSAATGEDRPAAPAGGRTTQIIVVFKTHFDIGYTDLAANLVRRYRTQMVDDALAVVDRSRGQPPDRQFAWTVPGWPLAKVMENWPGQTPERAARLRQAFADGRLVVHALPFTTHTELLETEDLVRGLDFASGLCRAAGLPLPRDAKMTDVPCHAWVLPTLLRRAGVEFLHLGCNAGSRSPRLPPLFWWEGPDGSRLLTFYSAEGYGTGLMPPPDWPHKTWLALIHTGDNQGPPAPEEIDKLFAEAAHRLPGVAVRSGRLSDFADALLTENPDLPVVRGDMPDSWIHGPLSDPAGAAVARAVRPRITAAAALATDLAAWHGRRPEPQPNLDAAREQSLLYGEHTWGGALYWVTNYGSGVKFPYGDAWRTDRANGRYTRLEASWAEHTAYIEKAHDLTLPVLERGLRDLAAGVGGAAGPRLVVHNPLPWSRGGPVDLPSTAWLAGAPALRRVDTGEIAAVETYDGGFRTVVRDLPAGGYATYVPVKADPGPAALRAEAETLESPFFRAVLDPARGCLRSLVDTRSGRELVDPAAPHGFGRLLHEHFDADQVAAYVKAYVKIDADWALTEIGKPAMPPAAQAPYRAAGPEDAELRLERTPLSVTAVMTSAAGHGLPYAVTTRVTLYRDLPVVDVEVTLHDKPADPWPEAGWLCFPFAISTPRFRLGRQNSVIDPAVDVVPGANRHLFAVTSGVAVFDEAGRGVGLVAPDGPLLSLDSPGVMRYSSDFVPVRPYVYVNLFNNHWTTNFRYWNEGTWTARVRLWTVAGFTAEASLVTPAWEARLPLLAAAGDGAGGALPPAAAGLSLSRRGVLVSAWGPDPAGDGLVLRLWEQAGAGGECLVQLAHGLPATVAQPCDLRGRPLGPAVPIRNGEFLATLEPWAPASYLLE